MHFRPYLLLSDATLHKMQGKAEDIVGAWRAAWGIASENLVVHCERAWEAEPCAVLAGDAWQSPAGDPSCSLRLSHSAGLSAVLESMMFPPEDDAGSTGLEIPGQDIARELVKEITQEVAAFTQALTQEAVHAALADLQSRFNREFGRPDHGEADFAACEAPGFNAYATGDVLVSVRIGAEQWHMWLAAGIVTTLFFNAGNAEEPGLAGTSARPGLGAMLKPALEASQRTAVQLPVMLGEVEIAVGSLLALNTGDVIRVPRPIDQPLDVLGPDGDVLFNGYLGQRGHAMVIEVVRPSTAPSVAATNTFSRKGNGTS
jgi:flagellar motor switch/type III secretory pathway protein FliN